MGVSRGRLCSRGGTRRVVPGTHEEVCIRYIHVISDLLQLSSDRSELSVSHATCISQISFRVLATEALLNLKYKTIEKQTV